MQTSDNGGYSESTESPIVLNPVVYANEIDLNNTQKANIYIIDKSYRTLLNAIGKLGLTHEQAGLSKPQPSLN